MENLHNIILETASVNPTPTPPGIAESITARFANIFPSWPIMLTTTIAFLIILIVITKLVYHPIKKMVKNRQNFIQTNIDTSINKLNESNQLLDKANLDILDAKLKAEVILKNAELSAEKLKKSYLEDAKLQTKRLLEDTKNSIEQQKRVFEYESKSEVVNIASEIAKKIIKENSNSINDSDFVNKLLENNNDK